MREGSIDLLGSSNAFEAADAQLDLSTPYADDMPVIVTREGTSLKNTPDLAGLRLAMSITTCQPAPYAICTPRRS